MARNKTLEAIVSIAGSLDPSLAKSLNSATKQFSGLKVGVAAVGTAAVAAASAVVAFGAASVKSAAEFETKMANVATLLDGDAATVSKRISELGDDVLDVSNKTGVSTNELSDGLYQIISAVGDSSDAISQMELAAKAAKAGGAETTDAINLLTAVTKGYGDTSQEAFQKASDLSFQAVKLGQTSFPELAASMGKVVPLASALNVSQEELYGSFATLTGVTGSTAEVATQMKAVMSGLMSPTDGMTKALESLGYANANAALDSLGLQGTLDALKGTVGGDTQAMAKMFSSVEAQTAILALGGNQAEDFASKTQAMYEATGATDKAFGAATDTLEYTISCIKNLGANFMTSVGRKILPIVKQVAEAVLPAIQEGLDKLGPVIDTIYASLSPVIEAIGEVVKSILPGLESKLSAGMDLFTQIQPVLAELGAEIMPIVQEAITAMAGAWEKMAPVIGTFISNLMPNIKKLIQALIPIIRQVFSALSPVLDMVVSMVSSLLPALTNVINFLMPIIQMLASIITSVLGNAFQYIMPIIQNVVGVFNGLMDFITNVFTANWSGAWQSVQDIFSNLFGALVGIAKAPLNGVIAIINGVIDGINNCGFTIPDWVPVIGGKDFRLDIPKMEMFANGGFTSGPSIAGEAGTEAVISFNKAARSENLSYWAQAGRMLGINTDAISSLLGGGTGSNVNNISYSPNIVVNGNASKADIIDALREHEEEFMDMLDDFFNGRGPVYG